ncbi:MAG TPA: EamA family transporter [Rhodospirillaceae bacterium]|nr:EamA family transporter [Candidatus Neomarinimicrobiota bacterium]HCX14189.1 EamA family transporter [Rhodospirillaceae bacterium]
MFMWAGNAIAGQVAVGEISPMLLTALRWVGVGVLIFIFARRRIVNEWPALRTRLPLLLALGALGFSTFNALFYIAAHSTVAINIGIINGALPVFVMLGTYIFYRTQVTGAQLIGVVVTLIGIAVVAARGDIALISDVRFNPGDVLMTFACLLYAAYTVALRERPAASGLAIFSIMTVGALATSIPLAIIEILMGDMIWPSPTGWAVALYVAIFPSLLSQLFFLRSVELIGPNRAGLFINLVPIITAAFGVILLNEDFHGYHVAALFLVLSGIWLAERKYIPLK